MPSQRTLIVFSPRALALRARGARKENYFYYRIYVFLRTFCLRFIIFYCVLYPTYIPLSELPSRFAMKRKLALFIALGPRAAMSLNSLLIFNYSEITVINLLSVNI